MLYDLQNRGRTVCFLWVPARAAVEGNEDADILAKQALRSQTEQFPTRESRRKDSHQNTNAKGLAGILEYK